MIGLVIAVWHMVLDVLGFWGKKIWAWYNGKKPVQIWLDQLRTAERFEEWEEAAIHLDNLLELDLWRKNLISRHFDHQLVESRLASLVTARENRDLGQMINLLRSGLVRNLGNITSPKLFNKALAGTKLVIEDYVTLVAETVEDITAWPTAADPWQQQQQPKQQPQGLQGVGGGGGGGPSSRTDAAEAAARLFPLTNQMKLDFVHDTRQAFGRTTLVLQGGAIFGLCHLGVMKALLLRGLLPRIITGTATGALAAALVGTRKEEDLLSVLRGDGIDLSAFAGKRSTAEAPEQTLRTRWETLKRRVRRFVREGYFLDVRVLEDCIRANVGELTFEEAYNRSGRILNITVPTSSGQGGGGGGLGVPILLNYITTPHVLIWTAAVASNANSESFYGRRSTTLLCRNAKGEIVPWCPPNTTRFGRWTTLDPYSDRDSPLHRVAELFNVNHFLISQARPYLIPFLQSDMHGPSLVLARSRATQLTAFAMRMVGLEVRHRLKQLDALRVLPASIRRFLVDEQVPGGAGGGSGSSGVVTLVPEVVATDFARLLETPTRDTLDYWILKGERSAWPAVAALRIRCAVEIELERSYQTVRTLKASASGLKRSTSVAVGASSQMVMPASILKKRTAMGGRGQGQGQGSGQAQGSGQGGQGQGQGQDQGKQGTD